MKCFVKNNQRFGTNENGIFAGRHRRSVRCSVEQHLPSRARRADCGRHRSHTLRLHSSIHHVQLLEQQTALSQLQILMEQSNAAEYTQSEQSQRAVQQTSTLETHHD